MVLLPKGRHLRLFVVGIQALLNSDGRCIRPAAGVVVVILFTARLKVRAFRERVAAAVVALAGKAPLAVDTLLLHVLGCYKLMLNFYYKANTNSV